MKATKLIGKVRKPSGSWVIADCPMQTDGKTKRKLTTQDDCARCRYNRMVMDDYTMCLYDEITLMEQQVYVSL